MNIVHVKTDWWYINNFYVTMFCYNENLFVCFHCLHISSNTWQTHERSCVDQQQCTAYSAQPTVWKVLLQSCLLVCLSQNTNTNANSQHSWLIFSLNKLFSFLNAVVFRNVAFVQQGLNVRCWNFREKFNLCTERFVSSQVMFLSFAFFLYVSNRIRI